MDSKSEVKSGQLSDGLDNEMNVGELLRSIWRTRNLVITTMLIAAISLAGLLAFMRLALPTTQTFKYAVQFVFSNVSKIQYPNGSKFAIFDLIAPSVLSKVYTNNNLEKYGISLEEFISTINVSGYSNIEEQVIDRYRSRLGNRKLTFVERKSIEKEMAEELENLSNKSAMLSFTLQKRIGISQDLGENLLRDIVLTWADKSINEFGVLDLPENLDQKDIVDTDLVKSLDIPLAAEYLSSTSYKLKQQLIQLNRYEHASTLVDNESGHTIRSLTRKLQAIIDYELASILSLAFDPSFSKSKEATIAVFNNRLREREAERATAARQIQIVEESYAALNESWKFGQMDLARTSAAGTSGNSDQSSGNTTTFGDGFFARLVQFVEEGLDKEGRIVERIEKLKLRNLLVVERQKLAKIDGRLLNDRLLLLNFQKLSQVNASGRSGVDVASLNKKISSVANALNAQWAVIQKLYAALSPRNRSYQGRLFATISLPKSQVYSINHPLFNNSVMILLLFGVLAAGLLALLAGILRDILRTR